MLSGIFSSTRIGCHLSRSRVLSLALTHSLPLSLSLFLFRSRTLSLSFFLSLALTGVSPVLPGFGGFFMLSGIFSRTRIGCPGPAFSSPLPSHIPRLKRIS